jgi:murein DD-endopeptidase MepM/ murein hydrolase activator NlpD
MKKINLLFVLTLLNSSTIFWSQVDKTTYHSPLSIPLKLSASFGDIRPNHFHMGVDFRTNGKVGLSLFSIEQGYVSRIKITPLGYGRVIYVNHPNGVTSVYAHCSGFEKSIQNIVLAYQEKNQLNEIDMTFTSGEIPVTKGQLIAYSGNSGNSSGPHLHFELRDTKSEKALHPLVHGFDISDVHAPIPSKIYLYPIDQNGYYLNQKKMSIAVVKSGVNYSIKTGKIVLTSDFMEGTDRVLIGVEGTDKIGADLIVCGLFENELIAGENSIFHSRIDTVSFDHNKLINDYCDYFEYKRNKKKIHKLIYKSSNHLDIYKSAPLQTIRLKGNDSIPIAIKLTDAKQNTSSLNFEIVFRKELGAIDPTPKLSDLYLLPDSSYYFEEAGNAIRFNPNALFEPVRKTLVITKDKIQLGTTITPLNNGVSVSMRPIESAPIDKQYIYLLGVKEQKEALKTQIINGKLEAKIASLGTFKVGTDLTAPTILPHNFLASDASIVKSVIQWKVDDLKTSISSYNLFIDSKWKAIEYDKKNKLINYVFGPLENGLMNFQLILKDACGNEAVWTKNIRVN